jgi:hypothetical protein
VPQRQGAVTPGCRFTQGRILHAASPLTERRFNRLLATEHRKETMEILAVVILIQNLIIFALIIKFVLSA